MSLDCLRPRDGAHSTIFFCFLLEHVEKGQDLALVWSTVEQKRNRMHGRTANICLLRHTPYADLPLRCCLFQRKRPRVRDRRPSKKPCLWLPGLASDGVEHAVTLWSVICLVQWAKRGCYAVWYTVLHQLRTQLGDLWVSRLSCRERSWSWGAQRATCLRIIMRRPPAIAQGAWAPDTYLIKKSSMQAQE